MVSARICDIMLLLPSTCGRMVTVPAGSYYVLGDNRDNSDDSRADMGFIPAANIVGRVAVKFFDERQNRVVWQSVN